jgi:hypothetical protein
MSSSWEVALPYALAANFSRKRDIISVLQNHEKLHDINRREGVIFSTGGL